MPPESVLVPRSPFQSRLSAVSHLHLHQTFDIKLLIFFKLEQAWKRSKKADKGPKGRQGDKGARTEPNFTRSADHAKNNCFSGDFGLFREFQLVPMSTYMVVLDCSTWIIHLLSKLGGWKMYFLTFLPCQLGAKPKRSKSSQGICQKADEQTPFFC